MPTVSLVSTWRVIPGRIADFTNNVIEAKKLHLKMGVDAVYVSNTVAGPNPGSIVYMMVFESTEKFGKFADSLSTNAEWQAFWMKTQQNQSAELLDQSMFSDLGL
jgi:hypothetical protein